MTDDGVMTMVDGREGTVMVILTLLTSFTDHVWGFRLLNPRHFVSLHNECVGIATKRYLWEP